MPEYEVTIHDMTLWRYVVDAESEEEAQEIAESIMPVPRPNKIIDSHWEITEVKKVE
jgi:hypothetical protein